MIHLLLKRHFLARILVTALLLGPSVVTSGESGVAPPNAPAVHVAPLAAMAYQQLKALPSAGISQSRESLEGIIATQRTLLEQDGPLHYQLAIALKEAVAHALIYELYRSEVSRAGLQREGLPASVPFEKQALFLLWKANMPNEEELLDKRLVGSGIIVSYHESEAVSVDELLQGNPLKEMPGPARVRFHELREQARAYALAGKTATQDELLVQALATIQTLRDLDIVVDLYMEQGLPLEYEALRILVDGVLEEYHGRRVDGGMKQSSRKIMSTFGKYSFNNYDDYCMRQAMLLGPFMASTDELPKLLRSHIDHRISAEPSSTSHDQE